MALSYIGREEGRVTWRMVLAWLVERDEPVTSLDLMVDMDLTMPDASNRLRRLSQWGMARRDPKKSTTPPIKYVVTDYGIQVNSNPVQKKSAPIPIEGITGDGEALLVVDMMNCCADEKWETKGNTFRRIREMAPKLKGFISEYRKNGPVIFVKSVPWTRENVAENVRRLYEAHPNTEYYSDPVEGSTDFYVVRPRKGDFVVTKDSYDAFSSPELISVLAEQGIRDIVMTGVFGDGCVDASIIGGFSRGYSMTMMGNYIETTDKRRKHQEMRMKHTWPILYGPVVYLA